MRPFSLSVPANVLLLGEYAVLEEGGRGLALAVSPRALAGAEPAASFSVSGNMGPMQMHWDGAGGEAPPPLVAACLAAAGFGAEGPRARIDLDSSAFFTPEGRKRGFGSSAAIAVGLVAALLRLRGLEGEALEEAIFPAALAAHRASQGGRGSGYDVAASRYGGAGIFSGGSRPSWQALEDLALPRLYLFAGPAAVSSSEAVARYQAWKKAEPKAHAGFMRASQACLSAFLSAKDLAFGVAAVGEAAKAGIFAGDALGVEARIKPEVAGRGAATTATRPGRSSLRSAAKALGAGNELGLLATLDALPPEAFSPASGIEELRIDREGLRWD